MQQSEVRLKRSQEIAHLGSWELDLVNNCLSWSDEVYRIFGLQPQEFGATYEAFLQAVHPDDRTAVDAAYSGSIKEGRDFYEIEHRVVRKITGEIRYVHEKCQHIRDESGKITRSIGMVHDITERKRAEEALQASEKRYRSYIEVTGELGWTTSADGEVVEDIPSFRKFTGQSYEEVKGWGWSKALHPDDFENTTRFWEKAVEEKNSYEIEYRLRRHDGVYRYFLARGVPVLEEGKIREWVGTCIDITSRKQAEQALKASEEKYHSLFTNMTEGFALGEIITDSNGQPTDYSILEANRAWEELTGLSLARIAGKPLKEIIPDLEQYWADCYGKVALTGEPMHLENYNKFTDHWYAIYAYSPQKGHFVSLVQNITSRKQAEEAMLRLNRELQAISQCNQAIVRVTDEQTLVKEVCRIMCDVVGYRMAWVGTVEHNSARSIRPEAWYGDDQGYLARSGISWADSELGRGPTGTAARTGKTDFCQDFITDVRATPWREEALKRGFRSSIAIPLFNSPGSVFAVFTLYAAKPNGFTPAEVKLLEELAGDLAFGINALRNRQERLQAEKELQQRTVELETVNRDLAAANKELETFSYSVSHDLRAPLRSLDGFSQALLEDYAASLDEQGKKWLQSIRDASRHMGQLIDDILGLSRVIRTELKLTKVDLSQISRDIAEKLKNLEPERLVEFDIIPGAIVMGDSNLLGLVLQNLLGNAFKFTAKCPQARIEFGITRQNGSKVYFVRDNGAGFDMKYVDKLFKPFQRLHSEKEYPGTGIGLVTIQRIIQRHGGQVWAEGEENKGASFYFTLKQGRI